MNILTISGVDCYEEGGTVYLKLESVARGLGFTRVADSGNEVVRWERVNKYLGEIGFMPTSGHGQGTPEYIPENVFYRLAMKAKNNVAERFQALVADEIIPSIRKNGGYLAANNMTDAEVMALALNLAQKTISAREERIATLEHQAELDRPKVVFADAVDVADNCILVGELAKILKQNGVENMGQNRLFKWLRENGYLVKRRGTDYNMPTQRSMEKGLFCIKESAVSHADGHTTVNRTPKVTGKGQQYFVNAFLAAVSTAS